MGARRHLTRASEIVFGLQGCLDFEKGGDVARILYNFYASADARIFALHRSGDVAECERIMAEFRQMREVWEEIDREAAGGSASAASAETPPAAPPAAPTGDGMGNVAISA